MRYASERDPQLVGLLQRASVLFFVGTPSLAIAAWRMHSDLLSTLSLVALMLGIGSLWTLRVTWYEIAADRLRIRCGPSRIGIPWDSLVRISPSQDRRNAPALSFNRLQVDYMQGKKQRVLFISPEKRAQFLEELLQRAALVPRGDAYIRNDTEVAADSRPEQT